MVPDLHNTIKDKLHVNITPVNSNPHADMYGMMRPLDSKETAFMQASVEKIYDRFTQIVAEGRNMSVGDVDAIAQGRVWTGAQALEVGLVDAIGDLDDAVLHAAFIIDPENGMDNIQVMEYPRPLTTLEMFTSMLTGEEFMDVSEPLRGIYSAFRTWDESQSGKVYARLPYALDIR